MKFHNVHNISGFTLIDILLTAAIISLLSSIFLFQVTEAKRKADDSSMKVEAQQVSTAISLYKNDNNGNVPLSVSADYNNVYSETDTEYQESMQLLVDGGYISEIPSSSDGQSYSYAVDENSNAFFAFKLKSSSNTSSNKKNSCPVTVENTQATKTFTSCQTLSYQDICIESSGVQCFPHGGWYRDDCGCVGGVMVAFNPSVVPLQICSAVAGCGGGISLIIGGGGESTNWLLNPPQFMCNYTLSGESSNVPACDGSSSSDYCECI